MENKKIEKKEESYDVFISYRRSNGFYMAKSIATWLKERKLKVFLDLDEATIGHFDERIEMALRNSKNVVLIMTEGCFDGCVVNGCANEDDWIANEIKIASEMNPPINIVPVKANGFKWPKEIHEQLPSYIKDLKRQERVSESISYIDAMVDRICQYLKNVKYNALRTTSTGTEFLQENILNNDDIFGVDIAFHTGELFRTDDRHSIVLDELKNKKINTRVLVNDETVLSPLKQALSVKSRGYKTFEEMIDFWRSISNDKSNNITVRVSPYLLMKRYYDVYSKVEGIMKLTFYTYGGQGTHHDLSQVFSSNHRYYDFFRKEFDYLWNEAKDI